MIAFNHRGVSPLRTHL